MSSRTLRPINPARRAGSAPRGSVLLMVVAVLALMAIIAVAYATLGRADRSLSASLVRESRLDGQAAFIKDYLAGVIADDACSTYAERTLATGAVPWTTRREATDYPGTSDYLGSSEATLNDGLTRFHPTGRYTGPWTGTGQDLRRPSDPWLASIEPTRLMAPGTLPPTNFNLNQLDDARTWAAISNFAPNGRFITLANLRNNFNAEPGVNNGAPYRMSSRLNLLDDSDDPTNRNVIYGTSVDANYSYPADYSNYQYRAFRPMVDNLAPSDPAHIRNQWADTDGDGFADARWFELADDFDPMNVRWLLPQSGLARLFIAARAIDLSGLININTANDFFYEPRAELNSSGDVEHFPAGLTPADIDLRRFLTTNDLNWVYRNATSFGYNAFEQGPGVANYANYNAPAANPISTDVGHSAYAAIRYAIDTGEVLPSDVRRAAPSNDPRLQVNVSEDIQNSSNSNPLTARQRARIYDEFGSDPASARNLAVGGSYRFRAPFGMADELELRTFNGVNDSDHTSRLERTAGGREVAAFSPFRENRPRAIEMLGRPASATGLASDAALLSVFADIRHLLTVDNGARAIIDNPAAGVNPNFIGALEYKTDALALLRKLDKSSGTSPTQLDVQTLFEVYTNALMPYTDETAYPDAWDRSVNRSRGLSYGESAELAQRLAAHLLVNTIDAMDSDQDPPLTGTYDRNIPTRIALEAVTNAPTHADFEQTLVVNLRSNFVPDVGEDLHGGSPRLNIYGIEAQPFLIEVNWYGMYTDTPHDPASPSNPDWADDEWAERTDDGQVPPLVTLAEVTINDNPISANRDFLFEVLAFQLTNPFDRPLRLSTGGAVRYYIEYSNRFFALAKRTDDGTAIDTSEDITLDPYETRVFYVTNIRDPEDIAARLMSARYTGGGTTPPVLDRLFVDQWARSQFGDNAVPIPMVHQKSFTVCDGVGGTGGGVVQFMDMFAEGTVPANGAGDLAQPPITPAGVYNPALRKVAMLWLRPEATTDPARDILLDRLRDPSTDTEGTIFSFRTIATGNTDIPDTEAGDDGNANAADDEDNTGFSITKWAGFRRPTNQSAVAYQRGSMPPWTLESKIVNFHDLGNTSPLNVDFERPAGGLGNAAEFADVTRRERRETLQALLDVQGAQALNAQIKADAKDKSGNAIAQNWSNPRTNFEEVAIQIHLSGGETNPQLFSRAGDFLLPLAIGPSYDPIKFNLGTLPTRAEKLEAAWMTLSEALALATNYYSPPAVDTLIGTGVPDPLHRLGHKVTTGTPIRPRLDRGNLVLTDFVPYLDLNGDGTFDPTSDETLGRGVPLAYNLVDMFLTTNRLKENAAGDLVQRTQTYGGPRIRMPGLININTAPLSVLRMIPMFAPDVDSQSWPTNTSGDPIQNPDADVFDIAAVAAAYRDKTVLSARPAGVTSPAARQIINFRDDSDGSAAINSLDGRFDATRIAAIRELPGFKSVGEILALRYHDPMSGDREYENSIDRFAPEAPFTPTPQLKTGLESTLWFDDSGAIDTDEMAFDYDQQLTIANAAINTITVRSDVFCVWFLVHGYLPSDVENLAPLDPMIPSIARRYVMVVDRSNVTQVGQQPNILLFQEVPIR